MKRDGLDGGSAGALFAGVRIGVEATAKAPIEKRGRRFQVRSRSARRAQRQPPGATAKPPTEKRPQITRATVAATKAISRANSRQEGPSGRYSRPSVRRFSYSFVDVEVSGLGYGPRGEDITEV